MKNTKIITKLHLTIFLFLGGCSGFLFFFLDYPLITWLNSQQYFYIKAIFSYLTYLGDGWFAFGVILFLFFISFFFTPKFL